MWKGNSETTFSHSYIDAFGSPAPHLTAAFRNVFHGGVVVVTATDVAALYGRAPDVLCRNYGGAYTMSRTDYTREAAVRILLVAIAQ